MESVAVNSSCDPVPAQDQVYESYPINRLGVTYKGSSFTCVFPFFHSDISNIQLLVWRRAVGEKTIVPEYINPTRQGALLLFTFDSRLKEFNYLLKQTDKFGNQKFILDPFAKKLDEVHLGTDLRINLENSDLNQKVCKFYPADDYEFKYRRPNHSWPKTVLYEMHVRGFTKSSSSLVKKPGTFGGIIEKIPYLKKLGVNAIEILPIFTFDPIFPNSNKVDYWGYNPILFKSIQSLYCEEKSSDTAELQFKKFIDECHKHELEVILDVVLNHTGEGDHSGPKYHFKFIGDDYFYLKNKTEGYLNYSGCGNTLNVNQEFCSLFFLNILKYWAQEMNVDGFRFDLASIFFRNENKGEQSTRFLELIRQDIDLSKRKLIFEPWDATIDGYKLGEFSNFGSWFEWNDQYRDTVRNLMIGESSDLSNLADRITGTASYFKTEKNDLITSINYITSHDGFTLNDLTCYNRKHNESNLENNQDGSECNFSINYGVEGPSNNKSIKKSRLLHQKSLLTLLLTSFGTPMIRSGDEFLQTKKWQ